MQTGTKPHGSWPNHDDSHISISQIVQKKIANFIRTSIVFTKSLGSSFAQQQTIRTRKWHNKSRIMSWSLLIPHSELVIWRGERLGSVGSTQNSCSIGMCPSARRQQHNKQSKTSSSCWTFITDGNAMRCNVVFGFWNEVSTVRRRGNMVTDRYYSHAHYTVVLRFVMSWSHSHRWILQKLIFREAVWLKRTLLFNEQWNGRCVPRAVASQLQGHISDIIMRNCWFVVWQTHSFHISSGWGKSEITRYLYAYLLTWCCRSWICQ